MASERCGGCGSTFAPVTGGVVPLVACTGCGRQVPRAALPEWYADHTEICALLCWLRDRGELGGVDECIGITEKPWHWTVEFDQMLAERIAEGLCS